MGTENPEVGSGDDLFDRINGLPAFAVSLFLFRSEGAHLQVLLWRPRWLARAWDDEWLPPELTLLPDETIPECADRLATQLAGPAPTASTEVGTFTRGKIVVGAVTACYACVPRDGRIRWDEENDYRWAGVEGRLFSRLFRDLEGAVRAAIMALSDDVRGVATLISNPFFTVVELQRALNEVRRLAGRSGQVDIRNLRRVLSEADWISDTSDVRSDGAHRPSRLYRVKER